MYKFNEFVFENENTKNISVLIGILFQSRDIAHLVHLYTGSFAAHKALNEYYDGLLPLIDKIAEAYQGITGKMMITIPASSNQDILPHLTGLTRVINNVRTPKLEPEIAALLDDVCELISTTLYKLKELK